MQMLQQWVSEFMEAKGVNDLLMVTLGTGLGSGFIVNGEIAYGHDGFAGELGHVTVEKMAVYVAVDVGAV